MLSIWNIFLNKSEHASYGVKSQPCRRQHLHGGCDGFELVCKGGDLLPHKLFFSQFCSLLKVETALRTGSNLDQQTALAFPQSEPRQAGLTPSILHLTNSRRD